MTEEQKQHRKEYQAEWQRTHKENRKAIMQRYWQKKIDQALETRLQELGAKNDNP